MVSFVTNASSVRALDPCSPKSGVTEVDGEYFAVKYFLESCTWQVPTGVTSVDLLAVGGGGGGGADGGGGGGGGGGALAEDLAVSANMEIHIGSGGAGGAYGDPNYASKVGNDGELTSVNTGANLIVARGGSGGNGCNYLGLGFCSDGIAGNNGGSGGVGDVAYGNLSGGNGGNGVWYQNDQAPTDGSNGFVTTILGSNTYFGGGGGGTGFNLAAGGGQGCGATATPGVNEPFSALENTGGGGAGGNGNAGGDGASGIVIIRYSLASADNPYVVGVRAESDGRYLFGQSINIDVEFNEPIQVIGNPVLKISAGARPKFATFDRVENRIAVFTYTVSYSDSTQLLSYESSSSLNLNGSEIVSAVNPNSNALLTLPDPGYVGSLSENSAVEFWLPNATALARPVLSSISSFNSQSGNLRRFVVKQEGTDGSPQTTATSDVLCSIDFAEFDSCANVFTFTRVPGYVCEESGVKDFGYGSCNDDRYLIFEVQMPDNVKIDLQVMAIDLMGGVTSASNHIQLVTDSQGPEVDWRRPSANLETTNTLLRPTWVASDTNSVSDIGTAILQVTTLENGVCNSNWSAIGAQANNVSIPGSPNHCYRWTLDPAISAQAIPPTDMFGNESTQNLTSPAVKVLASVLEQLPRQSETPARAATKPLQSMSITSSVKRNKSFTVPAKSAQGIQTYVVATGACKAKATTKTIKTKVGAKTVKSKVTVSYKITAGKAPGICSVQTYNNGDATYASFNQTTQVSVTP